MSTSKESGHVSHEKIPIILVNITQGYWRNMQMQVQNVQYAVISHGNHMVLGKQQYVYVNSMLHKCHESHVTASYSIGMQSCMYFHPL